jgi:hypothetical protein
MSSVVQVAGRQGMVVFAFACESETAPAQTLEQFPLEPSPHFDSPSKPSVTQSIYQRGRQARPRSVNRIPIPCTVYRLFARS